jgi:Flp pilus assembly pilin Flp
MFRTMLGIFRRSDQGQDLAEYCLLTALIALIALGIIYRMSGGMQGMWSSTGTTLVAANAATSAQGTTGTGGATTGQPSGQ